MNASLKAAMALWALAFTASAGHAAERDEVLAAAQAVFDPYKGTQNIALTPWERDIYAGITSRMIREWRAGLPEDELDDLSGFDWLCECQDYEPKNFETSYATNYVDGEKRAEVAVRLNLGFDDQEYRDSRLMMVKEDGRWLILDLVSQSFPAGLRADLEQAIEVQRIGE